MGHQQSLYFHRHSFFIHSSAADDVRSVSFHHVHVAFHRLPATQLVDNILYALEDHGPWELQAQTIHWMLRYTCPPIL